MFLPKEGLQTIRFTFFVFYPKQTKPQLTESEGESRGRVPTAQGRGPLPPAGPPVSPHSPLHPQLTHNLPRSEHTPTAAAIPDDIKVDIPHFSDQNAICFKS